MFLPGHYQCQKQGGLERSVRDGGSPLQDCSDSKVKPSDKKSIQRNPFSRVLLIRYRLSNHETLEIRSVFCLLLNIILHYVLMRCSDSASPISSQQEENLESRQTLGPKRAALPLALACHTHYRLGHKNTISIFLWDLFYFFSGRKTHSNIRT